MNRLISHFRGSIAYIPLEEDEISTLVRAGLVVSLAFGPGWAALKWDTSGPMPETVRQVGLMRGILNENMEGAGI